MQVLACPTKFADLTYISSLLKLVSGGMKSVCFTNTFTNALHELWREINKSDCHALVVCVCEMSTSKSSVVQDPFHSDKRSRYRFGS